MIIGAGLIMSSYSLENISSLILRQDLRDDFVEDPDNFEFVDDKKYDHIFVLGVMFSLMKIGGYAVVIIGVVILVREIKKKGKLV